MRKKTVQQSRSERRGESYSVPYVEPLRDVRTPLAVFFRILLTWTLLNSEVEPEPELYLADQHGGASHDIE